MKKYAKRLKEYDKIEFDSKAIISGMKRLQGARSLIVSFNSPKQDYLQLNVSYAATLLNT